MIDENAWKEVDGTNEFPTDGEVFLVRAVHTMRWEPYRNPDQATFRQAEEINGVKGRWQYLDDKGNWTNTARPKGHWQK